MRSIGSPSGQYARRSRSRRQVLLPAPYRVFITDLSYGHSIFIFYLTNNDKNQRLFEKKPQTSVDFLLKLSIIEKGGDVLC